MLSKKIRQNLKSPAYRDLFYITVITLVLILLGLTMHWTEYCVNLLYNWQQYPIDDVVITLIVTSVLLMFYAFRRNKEHKVYINNLKQSEKDILDKNDQLELLMNSISAVIFRVRIDADFTLLYTSENIYRVMGYTVEEMFIKNFWANNLHPDDKDDVFTATPQILVSGFGAMQYRFKHKDGSWRWMQAEMKCIYNEEGKPAELAGTWWDISRQKEIQDAIKISNDRFQLAARATKDILYERNLVNRQLWMSDEIFRSFGYCKQPDMTLEWWEEKIHHEDYDRIMNSTELARKNKEETWTGYYKFRRSDGTYADIADSRYFVYDEKGEPIRGIGSMSDITHLKKIEYDLNAAVIKANDSAKAKSEFLANMSHEIRTPLNGIVGMTDMALETDLNAEQKRYLDIVKSSCNSLMSLINDILDFSKIDAGMMELSPVPFSLRDELPLMLQPLGLKASDKNLEFIFSLQQNVPDLIIGDILRIQQVITNLVGNAIKFTRKGEIVLDVQLKSINSEETTLLFSVSDTGIGIPKEKQDSIFEEFTQADGSVTRKYGGTGLGLSISKHLVELMGGNIWVESRDHEGSTFYFTIVMKLQKKQSTSRFSALPVLNDSNILVVENNRLSLHHTMHILENFSMKPVGVESGEEALELLKNGIRQGTPFQVMIIDLSLSGKMDGFNLAEVVKQDKELNQTHIIVVSMSQKASDRERISKLGVYNYFTKPFSQSDLLDCIQNMLLGDQQGSNNRFYDTEPVAISHDNMAKYKILLVEDNLVNQEVVISMLTKKAHTVVIANNGEEAVALYKKEVFDFILMDVQMPVMNGYEATAGIRELEKESGAHILIIGLTANAMKGDREKCINSGMDEYLSKPVRMTELYSIIERLKQKDGESISPVTITSDQKPIVNLNTLLENLDNDHKALESVLYQFDNGALQLMASIVQHTNSNDAKAIIMPAHSLKGQAMHVEMHEVITLANTIETLALENKSTEIKPFVPLLQQALNQGLLALNQARENLKKEKAA